MCFDVFLSCALIDRFSGCAQQSNYVVCALNVRSITSGNPVIGDLCSKLKLLRNFLRSN
jgi:hypothetical protein